MKRGWTSSVVMVGCLASLAAPALAQPVAPRGAQPAAPQGVTRFQLAAVEGILEAAVQQGARVVSRRWRAVSPDVLFISGNARARGFVLESYGVFFDVEVPAMRQSLAWSWRMLDRDLGGTTMALQTLREHLKTVSDPVSRKELEQAVKRLELQMGPVVKIQDDPIVVAQAGRGVPVVPAGSAAPGAAQAQPRALALELLEQDPGEVYTTEVKNALIDAMLDHTFALTIGPEEWLTVAAHDNQDRRMGIADVEEAVTMLIRIKGADLQALRAGRLTRDEARQRVEIKEY